MAKTHKFPKQDKAGLDLIMMDLNDAFGSHSLDVHDTIVEIMEQRNIPIENHVTRKILSDTIIKFAGTLSHYDF